MREHLATFAAQMEARGDDQALPAFVRRELERFVTCGVLSAGIDWVRIRDLDALIDVLKTGLVFERMAAASALADFPALEAEAALSDALTDPDDNIKSSALSALARRYGPALKFDGLETLAGPERKWVEDLLMVRMPGDQRAVVALEQLGWKRAEPALRELAGRSSK